jgi:hypothetical protein
MGRSGHLRRTFRSDEIGLLVIKYGECHSVLLLTTTSHPRNERVNIVLHLDGGYNPGKDIIIMLTSLDEPAS